MPTAVVPQGPREGDQSSVHTLGLLLGSPLATPACVPALQAGRGSNTVSVTLWPKLEPAEQYRPQTQKHCPDPGRGRGQAPEHSREPEAGGTGSEQAQA